MMVTLRKCLCLCVIAHIRRAEARDRAFRRPPRHAAALLGLDADVGLEGKQSDLGTRVPQGRVSSLPRRAVDRRLHCRVELGLELLCFLFGSSCPRFGHLNSLSQTRTAFFFFLRFSRTALGLVVVGYTRDALGFYRSQSHPSVDRRLHGLLASLSSASTTPSLRRFRRVRLGLRGAREVVVGLSGDVDEGESSLVELPKRCVDVEVQRGAVDLRFASFARLRRPGRVKGGSLRSMCGGCSRPCRKSSAVRLLSRSARRCGRFP